MRFHERVVRHGSWLSRTVRSHPQGWRHVRRRYLFDLLRYCVPYVAVDTDAGIIFVPTSDRTVGRALFASGYWKEDAAFLSAVELAEARLGRTVLADRVVLEVGANIGSTTLLAARHASRVIAVEPAPDNFRLLRATVAANGIEDVVACVNAAASEASGSAFLHLSEVNSGEHRLSPSGTVRVDCVRLDELVRDLGIDDLGLIWIDAEGHEASVLAGLSGLPFAPPPTVIEFFPRLLGDSVHALIRTVEQRYADVVDLRTGRDISFAAASSQYRDGKTDLLLLPHVEAESVPANGSPRGASQSAL